MSTDLNDLADQAKQYAQNWVNRENQKTPTPYLLETVFTYTDEQGHPIYWKLRAKNLDTGKKFIRAFSTGEDGFTSGEPKDYHQVYLSGKGKKPLYALGRIVCAIPDDVIYIVEGEQKADYLNSLGLYATTCGGSQNATTTYLEPLKGRNIVVWADNDKAGNQFLNDIAELLIQTDCNVRHIHLDALELPHKGDVMDWVQIRHEKGLHTTAEDIQALETVCYAPLPDESQQPDHSKGGVIPQGHLAEPMQFDNGVFEILPTGVWYTRKEKNGNERTTFVSSPIVVLAKTRDNSSNGWGRLLQWHDDLGILHTWAVSMELFQTDGADLRKALANQGVTIASTGHERTLFQTYLMSYPVDQFAICVDRVGWYDDQYVLPCEVIGHNQRGEIVVYQSNNSAINKYSTQGTLQDWQQYIAKPIEQHSVLVTALCSAFTGQLLEPLEQQGKGLHIKGKSSTGKTTAIYMACTVWGNPDTYYHTWRNTSNAMEQTAQTHNDGVLILDEIGEMPNLKEIGNVIYMLVNGQGKGRMTKSITLREANRWRLVFLSSGEKTLNELMSEAGQKTKLGQEIRLINIDIDASRYGVFDQIDFAENGAKQSMILSDHAKRFYGAAGTAWLHYLTHDKTNRIAQIKALADDYTAKLVAQQTQGHIVRVASFFALLAAAGEAATQAGITAWQQGTAFNAVEKVFHQWLGGFEQVGDYEDREILAHVKGFFALHGSSRFEHIEQNIIRNSAGDDITPRIHNRMGYWKQEKDGKKYLVYPELFKSEICKGYDHKRVAKVLKSHQWIECDDKRLSKVVRLPNQGLERMTIFIDSEMAKFSIDEDEQNKSGNNGNSGNTLAGQGFEDVTTTKKKVVTPKKAVTNTNSACYQSEPCYQLPKQSGNTVQVLQDKVVTSVTTVTNQKEPIPDQTGFEDF